jgi:uncharacterized protein (DUF488 family)
MPGTSGTLYTIGHSNHPWEKFVDLLQAQHIEVLVDVRSQPYSRYTPHFTGTALKAALPTQGIKYLYLGQELGGRPAGREFYDAAGHVLYDRLAESPAFLAGIERLETGLLKYRAAIMCAEENPAACHRRRLVASAIARRGHTVVHIRGDGRLQAEDELRREEQRQPELFDVPDEGDGAPL